MYEYLRQHPDVFMSGVKETNYYAPDVAPPKDRAARTREEYEALFAGATTQRAIGEASPRYLASTVAAQSIRHDIPDARLIVSLRNPADRAYSVYLGHMREGRESRAVADVLTPGNHAYDRSFYYERLKRWYELFPREQIHVIVFEEFAADPARTMREMLAFLGVDASVPIDTSAKHNTAAAPRSVFWTRMANRTAAFAARYAPKSLRRRGLGHRIVRSTLRPPDAYPPEVRRRLLDAYRDDITATAALIGRDVPAWLE